MISPSQLKKSDIFKKKIYTRDGMLLGIPQLINLKVIAILFPDDSDCTAIRFNINLETTLFPHGPFQELINGAKMALNYLVTFPTMAICGGRSYIYPHI